MRITIIALVLCCVAYVNSVTPVQQCPGGRSSEEFKQTISIGRCRKPPCKLKKRSQVKAEFKFTPDRNIEKLTNTVNAIIVGIPFPFIGVDNTDACGHIFASDGTTNAGCPLKAGQEYIYKTDINVLEIYPRIKTTVHWALTANDGKDVVCFRVPAKITN